MAVELANLQNNLQPEFLRKHGAKPFWTISLATMLFAVRTKPFQTIRVS